MAISDYKITAQDLDGKGNIGMPDTPNLTTQEMQEKLDELSLDVIVPAINDLVDYLNENTNVDKTITADDITNLRLDRDGKIQVSTDHGATWVTGGASGHLIMDGSGTTYPARSRLQFSQNVVITDNAEDNKTFVSVSGDKGDPGEAATITIGNVYDSDVAEVTNVGSDTNAVFNFGLPRGESGNAASIRVGSVTSGQTASVYNTGTSEDAVFNFVLPKGDQGDPGTGLTLLDTYATYEELIAAHPTGQRGQAYFVGDSTEGVVYLWSSTENEWVNVGALKGQKGDQGNAATISIGTVTEGNTTSVENVGTSTEAVFNFTLKKGDKGDQGNAGTISVGTVTSGTVASVTNRGTAQQAVFDFVIPRGEKGEQGSPTVVNGKDGLIITLEANDINMGNYTKPSSTSPISGSDSIRTAIGKLEKAGDGYITSSDLSTVATSGNYNDLSNKPNLFGSAAAYSSTTSYTVGTFVTYNNTLYVCIKAARGYVPTNTTYWAKCDLTNIGGVRFGIDGDGNRGYYGADGSLIPFSKGSKTFIDAMTVTLSSVRTEKFSAPFCPASLKNRRLIITPSATFTSAHTFVRLNKYNTSGATESASTSKDLGFVTANVPITVDLNELITEQIEFLAVCIGVYTNASGATNNYKLEIS